MSNVLQAHKAVVGMGRIRELDGLRAVAALGVVATHVAFQTGLDPASHVGAVLARFDFFVAVFFTLSAFVLWRRYTHSLEGYFWSRVGRILPAYLVCVVAAVLFLPENRSLGADQILANLTFTQLLLPDGLVPGLTHLWSLAVEVAFYIALPLLILLLRPLASHWRILCVAGLALLSLGWAFLSFVAGTPDEGVANRQIWPPAYTLWFSIGIIAAEVEGKVPSWMVRAFRFRWPYWIAALVVAWVAGQEWFSPLGLEHPSPHEFVRRILAGGLFAALIVLPYALAPQEDTWLTRTPMAQLGQWSYSIFLWHVALMALVFPLAGIEYFSGGFVAVFILTVAVTIPVAACSYEFIERPAARWFKPGSWTRRRSG